MLDFEKNKPMLQQHGRQYINTPEDLKDELKIEWNNMILFASNEVLVATHQFIENPSQQGFRKVATAMRKDLWGGKISTEEIEQLNL